VPLGEILQDCRTVVADRGQFESLRLKSLFCVLQLHELRFAERSPIGRTEEEKDGALRPFERLVGLFTAELIGQSERRSRVTDLQTNRWRNRVIGRRVFLTARKSKESDKENDGDRDSHFGSIFGFVAYRCPPAQLRQSTTDVTALIHKSSESRSPHSSCIRLLNDHRDPKIPLILAVEIKFHFSGEPRGLIYRPDSDEAS
jgi:hypothetical protein